MAYIDLFSPQGHRVKDGMISIPCTSSTSKLMTLLRWFQNLGLVPSSPNLTLNWHTRILQFILLNIHLLGLKWHNSCYMDLALPFGLRFAFDWSWSPCAIPVPDKQARTAAQALFNNVFPQYALQFHIDLSVSFKNGWNSWHFSPSSWFIPFGNILGEHQSYVK